VFKLGIGNDRAIT